LLARPTRPAAVTAPPAPGTRGGATSPPGRTTGINCYGVARGCYVVTKAAPDRVGLLYRMEFVCVKKQIRIDLNLWPKD
jgi:hypothetical protein